MESFGTVCIADLRGPSGAMLSGTDLFLAGDQQGVTEPNGAAQDAFLGNDFFLGTHLSS